MTGVILLLLWVILIVLCLFLFSEIVCSISTPNKYKHNNPSSSKDGSINIYIINKEDIHNHLTNKNETDIFLTSTQASDFSDQLKESANQVKNKKELDYHKQLEICKRENKQLEIKAENIYDTDRKRPK